MRRLDLGALRGEEVGLRETVLGLRREFKELAWTRLCFVAAQHAAGGFARRRGLNRRAFPAGEDQLVALVGAPTSGNVAEPVESASAAAPTLASVTTNEPDQLGLPVPVAPERKLPENVTTPVPMAWL